MRLTELNPRGVLDADVVVGGQTIHDEHRDWMGISFECPHCRAVRIAVFYANPLDGKAASDEGLLWVRTGDSYETLTLSPSVDASKSGHWHGWIINGEVMGA